ncbi:MAG: hypothetical protein BWY94_02264 [Actinobacteria bacterium ADurb.BinA094]|nr:MAG: hypothetical protein BWY94_02264 [Actinobacteria bacterium ADurb.BinA094]
MLEARREQAHHAAEVAVLAERRRHEVMALVDDQQVPRKVRRALPGSGRRHELLEHVVLTQVVVRGDDAAERPPWTRIHAETAPQRRRLVAVDEVEPQRELLPHLVAPLQAQRGRREDQHPPYASADQELAQNQSRLDGLAQSHVVGEQQVDARHAQRLEQRHELVVLDLDRPMERAADGQPLERSRAVGVEEGHGGGPARGAQHRVEVGGGHGAGAHRVGEGRGRQHTGARALDLPDQLLLGWGLVVLVLDVDEVEPAGVAVERLDAGDHAATVTHEAEKSGARDLNAVARLAHFSSTLSSA